MAQHRFTGRRLLKILCRKESQRKENTFIELRNKKKMTASEKKRRIGDTYEKVAGNYLENRGYQILVYNFRCRSGEIDIIALKDGVLVFCEVKYRCRNAAGHPLEAVTAAKQKRICRSAAYYLLCHGYGTGQACRFDVIGILGENIIHLENAFMYHA